MDKSKLLTLDCECFMRKKIFSGLETNICKKYPTDQRKSNQSSQNRKSSAQQQNPIAVEKCCGLIADY